MHNTGSLKIVSYNHRPKRNEANDNTLACDWQSLRHQLLMQWDQLSDIDLDGAGMDRHAIAAIVQRKYGIAAMLVENYLANLERTLPLKGGLRSH